MCALKLALYSYLHFNMLLLNQLSLCPLPSLHYHLHFNMLLLNLPRRHLILINSLSFTFQYASIKPNVSSSISCDSSTNLHFNMLLLNQTGDKKNGLTKYNLHFNMLLLNPNLYAYDTSNLSEFTFQYASIKPILAPILYYQLMRFTFQYASIKPWGAARAYRGDREIYISICFY